MHYIKKKEGFPGSENSIQKTNQNPLNIQYMKSTKNPKKDKTNMFFDKKNNRISTTGFSLIELMVVLVIMVVLAILVISGYSEGRPRLAVERTTVGFIGDLNRARQKAQSSVEENNGEITGGGYGIRTEQGAESYLIYVKEYTSGNVIEEVKIETFAKIESVSPEDEGVLRIFFNDEGEVSFNGGSGGASVTFSAERYELIARTVNINDEGVAKITYIDE